MNVPDERFRWLCELYKPKSEVAAFLEIVDIAGLVRSSLSQNINFYPNMSCYLRHLSGGVTISTFGVGRLADTEEEADICCGNIYFRCAHDAPVHARIHARAALYPGPCTER